MDEFDNNDNNDNNDTFIIHGFIHGLDDNSNDNSNDNNDNNIHGFIHGLDEFDNNVERTHVRAALLSLVADDNRPQPRRFSRNPRRESGYERDTSYVGMTDSDIARSRWISGIDAEIHGYEEPRCYIVLGTHGFPLHGFSTRDDAETFVRDNADAAEIVEIPLSGEHE